MDPTLSPISSNIETQNLLTSDSTKNFSNDIKGPEEKDETLDWYSWDICLVFKVGREGNLIKIKKQKDKEMEKVRSVSAIDDDKKIPEVEDKDVEDPEEIDKNATYFKIDEKVRFAQVCSSTLKKLTKAGLHYTLYKSVQEDEVYCLVGASEKRLRLEADRTDYDLLMDKYECARQSRKYKIKLTEKCKDDDEAVAKLAEKGKNFYAKYKNKYLDTRPDRHLLYQRYNNQGPRHPKTLFRSLDRIRLTYTIMQAEETLGGAGLSINQAIHSPRHPLDACFPLHEAEKNDILVKEWVKPKNLFSQPLEDIRNYFGEKIAFYFAFLGFYCYSLILPAVVGFPIFIAQVSTGVVDLEILPVLGIFFAAWATLFLELWKRREASLRSEWGMTHYTQREQPRPEFKADEGIDPVTGNSIKTFDPWKKIQRIIISQCMIWLLIGAVIGTVIGIFIMRALFESSGNKIYSILGAAINGAQIQVMNVVYGYISVFLNEYENHRTPTEFENGLIFKNFVFKFINSYNSLFYIAFFKQFDPKESLRCVNSKDDDNYKGKSGSQELCLVELQIQLGTVFILDIFVNNGVEILLPVLKNWWSARTNAAFDVQGKELAKTIPEEEYEMEPYESTFEDFDEIAVQYGYVTLFVVAFPITPLLALINNFVEIRLDAEKIAKFHRRPTPHGAANIGTWGDMLQITSFISVITNALICVFFTKIIDDAVTDHATITYAEKLVRKVWVFLVSEHIILGIKFAIAYLVDDIPEGVRLHDQRSEFLNDVLVNGQEPEDEDDKLAREEQETKEQGDFSWASVAAKPDQNAIAFAAGKILKM